MENSVTRKASAPQIKTRDICLCGMFIALMTAGAFIKIQLPFLPMPITLQVTFAVLAGMLLGGKLGALSVAVYVIMGLLGIPVFTAGGGLGYVINPNFGYLYGFILTALVTGLMVDKCGTLTYPKVLAAAVVGLVIAYALGIVHMYVILNFVTNSPKGFAALLIANGWVFVKDLVLALMTSYIALKLVPILKKGR